MYACYVFFLLWHSHLYLSMAHLSHVCVLCLACCISNIECLISNVYLDNCNRFFSFWKKKRITKSEISLDTKIRNRREIPIFHYPQRIVCYKIQGTLQNEFKRFHIVYISSWNSNGIRSLSAHCVSMFGWAWVCVCVFVCDPQSILAWCFCSCRNYSLKIFHGTFFSAALLFLLFVIYFQFTLWSEVKRGMKSRKEKKKKILKSIHTLTLKILCCVLVTNTFPLYEFLQWTFVQFLLYFRSLLLITQDLSVTCALTLFSPLMLVKVQNWGANKR